MWDSNVQQFYWASKGQGNTPPCADADRFPDHKEVQVEYPAFHYCDQNTSEYEVQGGKVLFDSQS